MLARWVSAPLPARAQAILFVGPPLGLFADLMGFCAYLVFMGPSHSWGKGWRDSPESGLNNTVYRVTMTWEYPEHWWLGHGGEGRGGHGGGSDLKTLLHGEVHPFPMQDQ